jgi:hypothetical protein
MKKKLKERSIEIKISWVWGYTHLKQTLKEENQISLFPERRDIKTKT